MISNCRKKGMAHFTFWRSAFVYVASPKMVPKWIGSIDAFPYQIPTGSECYWWNVDIWVGKKFTSKGLGDWNNVSKITRPKWCKEAIAQSLFAKSYSGIFYKI